MVRVQRLGQLNNMALSDVMRIWTMQPIGVWRALRRERRLYVREDALDYRGYIPPAYRWLQMQLSRRLPAYCGHVPWWAYCRKPDLRRQRHLRPEGITEARLELEITDELVIRFPCWAWNRVFCEDYLAITRKEYESWISDLRRVVSDEDTWPLPQPWRSQLEASWERLFEPELPLLDWDEDSLWPRRACFEAIFEELRLDDVRHVTIFKGCSRAAAKCCRGMRHN